MSTSQRTEGTTRRLIVDFAYGIEDGDQATVIDPQAQYDGNDKWLALVEWNGHKFLINDYGRIIGG